MAKVTDDLAEKKKKLLDAMASGLPVAKAAEVAGVAVRAVTTWRRKDAEFSRDYTDVLMDAAAGAVDPANLVMEAYALATAGNAQILQFMLAAHLPYTYCAKARTLRIIDDQAREAAKMASETGVSESANIIMAHLHKLAAEKAGLVSGA